MKDEINSALKWKNIKVIAKVVFTRNVCVWIFVKCQEWGSMGASDSV